MKYLVITLILLTFFLPLKAQQAGEKMVFTLDECLKIAMSGNYDIQLRQAQSNTAAAQLTKAFGEYLPSLSYQLGYQRYLNPEMGTTANIGGQIITVGKQPPNNYNMSVSAQLNLFDGFMREYQYSQSKENYNSITTFTKFTLKKIEYDVIVNYIEVIKNQQIIKIRQENLALARAQLEKTKAQYEAGVLSITNVYAEEADVGNQELELIRSENDLNVAKANMLSTMGMNPDINAEFLDSGFPQDINPKEVEAFRKKAGSILAAIDAAINNRLDLRSQKHTLESYRSAVDVAQSGYFPRLSAYGGWNWSNYYIEDFQRNGKFFVGFGLSFQLFDNFSTNLAIQNAELQFKENELRLKSSEQSLRNAVQVAFLSLESTEKQLEVTEKTLKYSSQVYDSMRESYNIGNASITDLLTSTNQYINARINRITSVYYYIKAQKNLMYTIGNL